MRYWAAHFNGFDRRSYALIAFLLLVPSTKKLSTYRLKRDSRSVCEFPFLISFSYSMMLQRTSVLHVWYLLSSPSEITVLKWSSIVVTVFLCFFQWKCGVVRRVSIGTSVESANGRKCRCTGFLDSSLHFQLSRAPYTTQGGQFLDTLALWNSSSPALLLKGLLALPLWLVVR